MTKIRVAREDLLRCLAAVEAGLSPKDEVEQSSCYVFRGGRLWTFNDAICCSARLPAGTEGFEFAVPAAELRKLLTGLDEDRVELSFGDGEEGELIVSTSSGKAKTSSGKAKTSSGKAKVRRRAGLRVERKIRLPIGEVERPGKDAWTKLPKGFVEAVDAVKGVAGRDDNLHVLTCLHLTPAGIEATDAFQAIRYRTKLSGLAGSVVVSSGDLARVVSLAVEEWAVGEAWVHFRGSSGWSSIRRTADPYPSRSIDEALRVNGTESPLSRDFVRAASKASIFLDERQDRELAGVSLSFSRGRLKVRGEGPLGWYEEEQRIEYDGEQLGFKIAPRLLKEICERADHATVGEDKLRVRGENFVYVSCLIVDEKKDD